MIALGLLLGGFAVALTAHVAIALGLSAREPRWRAALALVVPPLGLYWAVRERMTARAIAWTIGVAAYLVAPFAK